MYIRTLSRVYIGMWSRQVCMCVGIYLGIPRTLMNLRRSWTDESKNAMPARDL